jgi:hypothetical protein
MLLAFDFLHTQDIDIGLSQELFDLGQTQANGIYVPRDKTKAHKNKNFPNGTFGKADWPPPMFRRAHFFLQELPALELPKSQKKPIRADGSV